MVLSKPRLQVPNLLPLLLHDFFSVLNIVGGEIAFAFSLLL